MEPDKGELDWLVPTKKLWQQDDWAHRSEFHMVVMDDGRICFRFRISDLRRSWRRKGAIAIDRLDHGGSAWSFCGTNLCASEVRIGWSMMPALDVEVEDWQELACRCHDVLPVLARE